MPTIQDVTEKMVARMQAKVNETEDKDVITIRLKVPDFLSQNTINMLQSLVGNLWELTVENGPMGDIAVIDIKYAVSNGQNK